MGMQGIARVYGGGGRYVELKEVGWWWQDSGRVWGKESRVLARFSFGKMYSTYLKLSYCSKFGQMAILVPQLTRDFQGIGVSTQFDDTMNDNTPVVVTYTVEEGVTPSVVDMMVEKEKISSLEDA
nr:hypothetical protein [Tanacetum cinerariifolium]